MRSDGMCAERDVQRFQQRSGELQGKRPRSSVFIPLRRDCIRGFLGRFVNDVRDPGDDSLFRCQSLTSHDATWFHSFILQFILQFIHSAIHSFIHSAIHSFCNSFIHSLFFPCTPILSSHTQSKDIFCCLLELQRGRRGE